MRRALSILFLILILAGGAFSLHLWKEDALGFLSEWIMVDKEIWVEKPMHKVTVELGGAPPDRLEISSKKISNILSSVGDPAQITRHDSPAARFEIQSVIQPAFLIPLREIVKKTLESEPHHAAVSVSPAKKSRLKAKGKMARSVPEGLESPKLNDLKRRRESLMKTWAETERRHMRVDELRRQYRHPEELLRNDEEALELKKKLVDLEMTLAEIVDHYTPAHPRVKSLQDEIAAVRSSLDRRVMVAEEEERAGFAAKVSEFQQKKARLDREEKNIRKMPETRPSAPEKTEPPVQASDPGPEISESVQMNWSEAQTTVRELVMKKELDPERLTMGVSAALILMSFFGYLFGMLGTSSARSASPDKTSAPMDAAAPPDPSPPLSPRLARARAPLPPIDQPPPPPAPEKIVEEEDMPGMGWISLPQLPKVEKGLYTVFSPTSPASELFSKAAADLLDRLPKSEGSQVITVAALRSGTGTSTFVANLAVALLQRRPVLLLDFHHTAPSLHTYFSIEPSSRDMTSSAPWTESILQTPIERLSLLPLFSPHTEKEIADLKLKKRLQSFLGENPIHRLVLIDLAPLGRSDLFEDVAENSDMFLLMIGPDAPAASIKPALKRLGRAMGKNPILRIGRTNDILPNALAPSPSREYEFLTE